MDSSRIKSHDHKHRSASKGLLIDLSILSELEHRTSYVVKGRWREDARGSLLGVLGIQLSREKL